MFFRRAFSSIVSSGFHGVTPMPFLWRAPSAASTSFAPPSLLRSVSAAMPASSPDLYFKISATAPSSSSSSSSAAAGDSASSSYLLSSTRDEMSLRGPNSREPRKSNHGARPCSSVRRRRKYRTRVNEHPYIPLSKQKQKKGMDFVAL